MKIAKIQIGDYLQFKNLNLDLTYPEGHEKAGKPLDKVCFIGQSGTGKTSLLNLVRAIMSHGLIKQNYIMPAMKDVDFRLHSRGRLTLHIRKGIMNGKNHCDGDDFLKDHYKDANIFIYFSAEMNVNLPSIFASQKERGLQVLGNEKNTPSVSASDKPKFFDFEKENIEAVWNLILEDIQKYKVAQLSFNSEISNRLERGAIAPEGLVQAFLNWKKENPNPLKKLAEQLNPMLARFNLEIKPEFEFKTLDDLRFIQIYQKDSNTMIPNSGWSTGTKQLIMTATPLLKLNTEKSVILIDEPERSFYPDVQRDLMSFYRHLAPEAQFFVATHSPIIAASFEPWEIVELKFGENGNIVQEQYYDGERHINNYRFHPKYLRWDAILTRIFDLETDGMPDRNKKLQELARLDVQLRKLKKESGNANDEKAQKLWVEFKEIANLLDWKLEN